VQSNKRRGELQNSASCAAVKMELTDKDSVRKSGKAVDLYLSASGSSHHQIYHHTLTTNTFSLGGSSVRVHTSSAVVNGCRAFPPRALMHEILYLVTDSPWRNHYHYFSASRITNSHREFEGPPIGKKQCDDSRVAHRGCYIIMHVMSSSVLRIRMITDFLFVLSFYNFPL
jgi:hypothetical protein